MLTSLLFTTYTIILFVVFFLLLKHYLYIRDCEWIEWAVDNGVDVTDLPKYGYKKS